MLTIVNNHARGLGTAVFPCILYAQASATLTGRVVDPDGSAVAGAASRSKTAWPVSSTRRSPMATARSPSRTCLFKPVRCASQRRASRRNRSIALRSNIPVALEVRLALAMHAESVQVTASDEAPLVDPQATGTRAELNARAIERMPLATGTRGLESVLLSFPGFAADANGAIHPRGAHNQMTYVIDGMPVTDQLTGAFGTAVDAAWSRASSSTPATSRPSSAENFRRGQHHHAFRHRLRTPLPGSLETAAGGFDTLSERVQAGGGTPRFGYFGSFHAVKSHRFLDQVSLDNLHNGGNAERGFARLDWQAGARDALRFNLMSGARRSSRQPALPARRRAGPAPVARDYSRASGGCTRPARARPSTPPRPGAPRWRSSFRAPAIRPSPRPRRATSPP